MKEAHVMPYTPYKDLAIVTRWVLTEICYHESEKMGNWSWIMQPYPNFFSSYCLIMRNPRFCLVKPEVTSWYGRTLWGPAVMHFPP